MKLIICAAQAIITVYCLSFTSVLGGGARHRVVSPGASSPGRWNVNMIEIIAAPGHLNLIYSYYHSYYHPDMSAMVDNI